MGRTKTLQLLQAAACVVLLSMFIGGHASATKARTDASRLRALERQVGELAGDLESAKDRITSLEGLTQLLDQEGTYYGYVNGAQVWSHHCETGTGAMWEEVDGLSELSCSIAGSAEGASRLGARKAARPGTPFDGSEIGG